MYKNKKTGIIGIIITVVVLILVVILSNINIEKFSYLESIFNSFVMPVQNGITYLKNKVTGNKQFFVDVNHLKEENDALKEKNSELEKSLRELELLNQKMKH